ncbi:amidohydrolase family protein [Aquisalimonas sp. 2447]|uniref:amidohydrolase family protein n=1 Tax=Aquisalimonas sp. 2447 TaxID=2740807 RepID=UPI001432388D|nr:amidohydrolase family protein [Aquisalimonas sp. 2447]QIT54486.1 amidohydrolase family protein [Aquisalimonas sp. 2447]
MTTDTNIPMTPAPVARPSKPDTPLPSGSCDSHAHVFDPAGRTPLVPTSEYAPAPASLVDYENLLATLGFDRGVLVQPSVYGTDNRNMLECLEKKGPGGEDVFRGVVVVDDSVTDRELEAMHAVGVRGIRVNVVFGGGVDFDVLANLGERIAPLGWHVQCFVDLSRLPDFAKKAERLPVPVVVDHMGHFPVARHTDRLPAFQDLVAMVREGQAWVKLSGPNRISGHDHPPFDDVRSLVDALVAANPQQLVFGTDWPHVKLPTPVPDDGALINAFHQWISDIEIRHDILVRNPGRLYGFNHP